MGGLGLLDTYCRDRRRERLAREYPTQASEQHERIVCHPHRHLVLGRLAPAPVLPLWCLYGAWLLDTTTSCERLLSASDRADVYIQQHARKYTDGCPISRGLQLLGRLWWSRRAYHRHHRCAVHNLGCSDSR